jgi:hypothetical protein
MKSTNPPAVPGVGHGHSMAQQGNAAAVRPTAPAPATAGAPTAPQEVLPVTQEQPQQQGRTTPGSSGSNSVQRQLRRQVQPDQQKTPSTRAGSPKRSADQADLQASIQIKKQRLIDLEEQKLALEELLDENPFFHPELKALGLGSTGTTAQAQLGTLAPGGDDGRLPPCNPFDQLGVDFPEFPDFPQLAEVEVEMEVEMEMEMEMEMTLENAGFNKIQAELIRACDPGTIKTLLQVAQTLKAPPFALKGDGLMNLARLPNGHEVLKAMDQLSKQLSKLPDQEGCFSAETVQNFLEVVNKYARNKEQLGKFCLCWLQLKQKNLGHEPDVPRIALKHDGLKALESVVENWGALVNLTLDKNEILRIASLYGAPATLDALVIDLPKLLTLLEPLAQPFAGEAQSVQDSNPKAQLKARILKDLLLLDRGNGSVRLKFVAEKMQQMPITEESWQLLTSFIENRCSKTREELELGFDYGL